MSAQTLHPEIYPMILAAMKKFGTQLYEEAVAHKAERAMLAVAHVEVDTVTVDGQPVTGKRLLLADQKYVYSQMREDHRYNEKKRLYLLIGDGSPRYLLRTDRIYEYFEKVIFDDVPGGCAYRPTEEKLETVWSFTCLEDIREEMMGCYH